MLQDFKVRIVPSSVVITLWSSLPQIHTHCFSDAPDFATLPFIYFLTLHRIAGMEPTPFSPSPLTPSLYRRDNIQHNVSSDAKMFSTSPLLLYATGFLEDEAGPLDEHGEGWNAEGRDTWRRVCMI